MDSCTFIHCTHRLVMAVSLCQLKYFYEQIGQIEMFYTFVVFAKYRLRYGKRVVNVQANCKAETWPRDYKTFFMLNSTEHEIFLLINVKMPAIVGILTFMSGKKIAFSTYLSLKKAEFLYIFILMIIKISCSTELCMKKVL